MDNKLSAFCNICEENVNNPCRLPCQHVFCFVCLRKELGDNGNDSGDSECGMRVRFCPACSSSFEEPSLGLESFCCELLDIGGANSKEENGNKTGNVSDSHGTCEICCKANCSSFCIDCNQGYCTKCILIHSKIPSVKCHIVEELKRKEGEEKQTDIEDRSAEVMVYCEDCQERLTLVNFASDHNQHKIQLISDFLRTNHLKLNEKIALISDKYTEVETQHRKIKLKVLKSEKSADETKRQIQSRAKLLKNLIDAHAEELRRKVDSEINRFKSTVEGFEKKLTELGFELKQEIESCKIQMENPDTGSLCLSSFKVDSISMPTFFENFVVAFKFPENFETAKLQDIFGSLKFAWTNYPIEFTTMVSNALFNMIPPSISSITTAEVRKSCSAASTVLVNKPFFKLKPPSTSSATVTEAGTKNSDATTVSTSFSFGQLCQPMSLFSTAVISTSNNLGFTNTNWFTDSQFK